MAPSSALARASSPSSPFTAAARSLTTSSYDFGPASVVMPSRGISRFCGVVHIWPL